VSWPFVFAICEELVHVHRFKVVGAVDPELVLHVHPRTVPVIEQAVQDEM
jgi:hypothetical protein